MRRTKGSSHSRQGRFLPPMDTACPGDTIRYVSTRDPGAIVKERSPAPEPLMPLTLKPKLPLREHSSRSQVSRCRRCVRERDRELCLQRAAGVQQASFFSTGQRAAYVQQASFFSNVWREVASARPHNQEERRVDKKKQTKNSP
eukprot:1083426-Rhodomonas_salina.1